MKSGAASEPVYLGVDIGGTKVAAGWVTARGRILARTRVPMVAGGDAATGLDAVLRAIAAAELLKPGLRPAAIGISCPGPLDPRKGVVVNPPNLPCWKNYPLARKVQQARKVPVHLDNDANAAALAEARWGAGARHKVVFYATLGTGIGTGLVLDGRIFHGRTGAAVEGGHLSLDYQGPRCACGKLGCIEVLASGPAVALRARAAVRATPSAGRKMIEHAGGAADLIHAEAVAAAWRDGDRLAAQVLEQTARLLAIWLGNVVDLLEPEVIIFGGGMGELMAGWFDTIRAQMPAWTINSRAAEIPMLRARYGEDSGIAGGAALCIPAAAAKPVPRRRAAGA